MSVSPEEFVERFRAEHPDERLTYQKILNATGLKDLRYTDLRDANLRDVDLRDATLLGAILQGADLWNADLENTNLHGVNLLVAKPWSAILLNADAKRLTLR